MTENINIRFPFLTVAEYCDKKYIGIIQNYDNTLISMYVYERIGDEKLRALFLKFGESWWWESNRQIPINIFFGDKFNMFSHCLMTFSKKNFIHLQGPYISLNDINTKKIKRKTIHLYKKKPISEKR